MHNSVYLFMQWLENDFLKYLNEWKESTKHVTDDTRTKLSDSEQKKLCISEETLEGLHITGWLLNAVVIIVLLQ